MTTILANEIVGGVQDSSPDTASEAAGQVRTAATSFSRRFLLPVVYWPYVSLVFLYQLACLCLLLAIAATVPIVQWASLGYMLESAARIAKGRPWKEVLPGLQLAGRIGKAALGLLLTWLPVWLITQYAYQAELVQPSSYIANRWRVAATIMGGLWMLWAIWAMVRGGRIRDFLWPAPIRFIREILQRKTWSQVEDRLWDFVTSLQLPRLTWLGFRAFAGALIWLAIPGILIIFGMNAHEQPGRFAIGLLGALAMWIILLYLPFLQVHMAKENRFKAIFDVSKIRADFKRAPFAFFIGLLFTLALAIPLYLLRIETPYKELMWMLCLVFVVFTFPAKLVVGVALRRGDRPIQNRWWGFRWFAWLLQLSVVPIYILFLYLGTIATWDGPAVVLLQHAFLTPIPIMGR